MKMQSHTAAPAIDRLGSRLAARLDEDMPELSYDLTERLRASRMQALAVKKPETVKVLAQEMSLSAGQAALKWGGEGDNLWSRVASLLPLIALIVGLMVIQSIQSENSALEIAEVDSALLIDDLPPNAYTDPGFLQFLKTQQSELTEIR
jgi:hypothetical protein